MLSPLLELAQQAELDILAYLLDMARLEAEQHVYKSGAGAGGGGGQISDTR